MEQRRLEIEADMRRDLDDADLDLRDPFVISDSAGACGARRRYLLPADNLETVDEALDRVDALAEDEPDEEPTIGSPQEDASSAMVYQRATGEDEDAYIEEMCGVPDPEDELEEVEVEEEPAVLQAKWETFRFRGNDYVLHPMPQNTLRTEKKRLWFKHGDLSFMISLRKFRQQNLWCGVG